MIESNLPLRGQTNFMISASNIALLVLVVNLMKFVYIVFFSSWSKRMIENIRSQFKIHIQVTYLGLLLLF